MTTPTKHLANLLPIAVVALLASCGGGDTSGPAPSVATTITANSSTTLSAPAGTAVTPLPSVLVRDQRGAAMAGVAVGFAVTTGGGTLTQPSAVTDASGIATVGGWTLGTAVGSNTMIASTGSLSPVTFTAAAVAGLPASVTKASGDAQTATVGTAVAIAPSVAVKDANGNLVSGASVTFSVATGGGTISGATTTTNSAGVAVLGSWTLGTTAGPNTLTATAGSASATFSATGTAGAAASVIKTAGDNQTAAPGTAVAIAPSVKVSDANGNPVSGVGVIFSIGSGNGALTGGTQTTNSAGIATVGGWTLGPTPGTANTLLVNAGSLATVTFNATASGTNPCSVLTPYTIGTTVTGDLSTADCTETNGYFVDYYGTSASPAGGYLFQQTAGPAFDTFLELYALSGTPVAFNDDSASSATNLNSFIKALLPAGNYVVGASSALPRAVFSYSVSSSSTSPSIDMCEEVFVARGITTSQTLAATDCASQRVGGFYSDDVIIFLAAGQTVTVSMNSTVFDAYLEIYSFSSSGALVLAASNDNKNTSTTDAQVSFTATVSNFYLISPSSALSGATGAYILIIQ